MSAFPHFKQADQKDCGPTCLKIIAKHYGKTIPIQKLRRAAETDRSGSSIMGMSEAAEAMGFRSLGVKMNYEVLKTEKPFPCIVHWNKQHFAVVYKMKKGKVHVSDPSVGLIKYSSREFIDQWVGNDADTEAVEGVALLLEPTPHFYKSSFDEEEQYNLKFVSKYLLQYKSLITQLLLGLGAASLLQMVFPFLTQSIVDIGIQRQDLQFIYLILIAQLFLFFGRTAIEVIRSWILLHISARINISLISDFFI